MLSSTRLWGHFYLDHSHPRFDQCWADPARAVASLRAWLERRRAAVETADLSEHNSRVPFQVLGALSVLPRLRLLDLSSNILYAASLLEDNEVLTEDDLAHLAELTALEELRMEDCELEHPPQGLAALSRLHTLSLSGIPFGNQFYSARQRRTNGAKWDFLLKLPALRTLDLGSCGFHAHLPSQLFTLSGLQTLIMPNNSCLGSAGLFHRLLSGLRGLTHLCVTDCRVWQLPPALAGLQALQSLELGMNRGLGFRNEDEWAPLGQLTALTKLDLHCCELRQVPTHIAALTRLECLSLFDNDGLGESGAEAFAPLCTLTHLTSLYLSSCGLLAIPDALRGLQALKALDLNYNPFDSEGSWAALGQLTGLTELRLEGSGLERLPVQLSTLTQLQTLSLHCRDWAEYLVGSP